MWIPKPGKSENKKKPLPSVGIPTIKDRCLQALFKLALEPEWEAKLEENSYGFRPGRNCHDAIAAVRSFVQKRPKYVLDADIAKCLRCGDRINHEKLLDKIGMIGKYRKQLKYWLKSGVLDKDVFSHTDLGTPQGGVISITVISQYCFTWYGRILQRYNQRVWALYRPKRICDSQRSLFTFSFSK